MAETDAAKKKLSRRHTQWAAQFVAASELTKRGYDVNFTLGNCTPEADLFARSPNNITFMIEVKGMRTKNFWLISRKDQNEQLYYILVFLADGYTNRFFIMSHLQVLSKVNQWEATARKGWDSGKFKTPGFNWTAPHEYEDKWSILPS